MENKAAPIWTPKPTQYLPATWKCGHVDHWPVNLLKIKKEAIESRDCPECRAAKVKAIEDAERDARHKAYEEWRATKTPEQLEEIERENLRKYFAEHGCE